MFTLTNSMKNLFDVMASGIKRGEFPNLASHTSVQRRHLPNDTESKIPDEALFSAEDFDGLQVDFMDNTDLLKLVAPMPGAYVTDDFELKNYPEVMGHIERLRPKAVVSHAKRPVIIDQQSYMAQPTGCLRTRVVTLLRLLEADIRCIENTRGLEMYSVKNPLNELVMRDHKALYKTLKEIKAKGGQVLKEFHDAIDNLGYWGGYKKDERVIRIHHPNLPYGYIEV